jgi:uncharacterized protein YhbP (UPF0306 family)
MNQGIDNQYISNFLNKNTLAVVSTVDKEGRPHAAPVFYVMDENFDFFFITPVKTRKNINLDHQQELIMTVTDEENRETVQIRGLAHRDEGLLQSTLKRLSKKLSHDLEFVATLPLLQHKNQHKTVVIVRPSDIRFRKYHEDRLEEKKVKIG